MNQFCSIKNAYTGQQYEIQWMKAKEQNENQWLRKVNCSMNSFQNIPITAFIEGKEQEIKNYQKFYEHMKNYYL